MATRPGAPVSPATASRDAGLDVTMRLQEIDPSFVGGNGNRFDELIKKGKSSVEKLIEALKHNDAETRADAAEALGRIGDTKALNPLRERVQDADGEVRTQAAVALIRIGDEQLFPEVVKALRHEDPRIVVGAAIILGRLADARVVPNLVEAFKTTNTDVGSAVAWAIGQCGDAAALPWLMTAVERGFVAANACEALGRIGDMKAQPVLLKALESPADDVRAYAARALGMLRSGGTKSVAIKSAAGLRMGMLSDNKAAPALRKLLSDRSRKVRLCAAIALYELGDRPAGRTVVENLKPVT